MINSLIEKYKKKIVDLKGFKGEDRYLQKQENNYYQEIIKDLEELKEPTICGYSIEEITTILQALELERILDIKITMKNLSILSEKIHEDFNTNIKKQFEHMAQRFNDTINSDLVEKKSDIE